MLVVALMALLIAVGLVACGGGDSSSSTTTGADRGNVEGGAGEGASTESGDEGGSDSGGESGDSEAGDFAPERHNDSGGGSAQFKVKSADNSVQEFGEEADAAERDAAAVALHNFLDARAEGDWAAACEYVSSDVVESLEKLAAQAKQSEAQDCAGILEALTNPAAESVMKAEAEKADVGSLRIEGEKAFIIYTGVDGAFLAMPMTSDGGDWKVASLAGTPLN
jgi:hypothetical protein